MAEDRTFTLIGNFTDNITGPLGKINDSINSLKNNLGSFGGKRGSFSDLTQSMGKVIGAHIKLSEQVKNLRSELTNSLPVLREYRKEVGKTVGANMMLQGKGKKQRFVKSTNPTLQFLDEATRRTRELATASRGVRLGGRLPRGGGGGGQGGVGGGGGRPPRPPRPPVPPSTPRVPTGGGGGGGGGGYGGGGRTSRVPNAQNFQGYGVSRDATFAFGQTLGYQLGNTVSGAVVQGFQIGVGLMMKPFQFIAGAMQERIQDELSDISAAGGLLSVAKRQKGDPLVKNFQASIDLTQQTNKYMAEIAAALPGNTQQYIEVGKRMSDTVARMISMDSGKAIAYAKELAAKDGDGRSIATQKDAYTQIVGNFATQGVLAGLGDASGGGGSGARGLMGAYGLPQLMERMMNDQEVSMGQFQRYAAIFRDPKIMEALERFIPKINETMKGTVDRARVFDKFFEEVLPPEMIRAFERSTAGILEAFKTAIGGPETGFFGLGRKIANMGKKMDAYGNYLDANGEIAAYGDAVNEALSFFDMMRDIFANISIALYPLVEILPQIFDPIKNITELFINVRHISGQFLKSFESYSAGMDLLLKTTKKGNIDFAKTKKARAAMLAITNFMTDIGAFTEGQFTSLSAKITGNPSDQLGVVLNEILKTFFESDAAGGLGNLIGSFVGTTLKQVATVLEYFLGITTTSKLASGIKSGFAKAGGYEAAQSIMTNIFKGLLKLVTEIFMLAPAQFTAIGSVALLLPAFMSAFSITLANWLEGYLATVQTQVGNQLNKFSGVSKIPTTPLPPKNAKVTGMGPPITITTSEGRSASGKGASKVTRGAGTRLSMLGDSLNDFLGGFLDWLDSAKSKFSTFRDSFASGFDDLAAGSKSFLGNIGASMSGVNSLWTKGLGKLSGFLGVFVSGIDDFVIGSKSLLGNVGSSVKDADMLWANGTGKFKGFLSLFVSGIDDFIIGSKAFLGKIGASIKNADMLWIGALDKLDGFYVSFLVGLDDFIISSKAFLGKIGASMSGVNSLWTKGLGKLSGFLGVFVSGIDDFIVGSKSFLGKIGASIKNADMLWIGALDKLDGFYVSFLVGLDDFIVGSKSFLGKIGASIKNADVLWANGTGKFKGFLSLFISGIDDFVVGSKSFLGKIGASVKNIDSLWTKGLGKFGSAFSAFIVAISNFGAGLKALPSRLPAILGSIRLFFETTLLDFGEALRRMKPGSLPGVKPGSLPGVKDLATKGANLAKGLPVRIVSFAKGLRGNAATVTKGATAAAAAGKGAGPLAGLKGFVKGMGATGFQGPIKMLGKFGFALSAVVGVIEGVGKLLSGGTIWEALGAGAGPVIGTIIGTALLGPLGGIIGGMIGSLTPVTDALGEAFRALFGAVDGVSHVIMTFGGLVGDVIGSISSVFGGGGEFDGLKVVLAPLTLAFQALEVGLKGLALLIAEIRVEYTRRFGTSDQYQEAIGGRNRLAGELEIAKARADVYNDAIRGSIEVEKKLNDMRAEYASLISSNDIKDPKSAYLRTYIQNAEKALVVELNKEVKEKEETIKTNRYLSKEKKDLLQAEINSTKERVKNLTSKPPTPVTATPPKPGAPATATGPSAAKPTKPSEPAAKPSVKPDSDLVWLWKKIFFLPQQPKPDARKAAAPPKPGAPAQTKAVTATATNTQEINKKAATQITQASQTKNAAVKTQTNTSTANTTLGNIRAGLVAVSNKITGLQYVQQIYSLLASGGLNVKTSLSTPLQINSPFGQPAFPGLTLPPLANPYPLPPSPPKPLDPNKWVLGNPFESYRGSLGDAVKSELKNKPAGSDLVIANSSETVIPAAGGHGMEAFIGAMRAGFNSIVQTYSQVQQKQEGVLSTGFSRIQQSYASSAQQQQNALNKINSTLVSNQQQTNTRLSTLETKFTSPSFGGLGGGSVGGGVDAFTPLAQQMGLTMTSGYRPGDPGWHGANRARDFSNGTGPTPQMLQFAQMLASRYGSNLKELIYTPLGFSIKNGQRVAPYAQGAHYNHVHVAYNQGNIGPLAEEMKAMPFGSKLGVVNSSEFVANREQTGLLAKALRGYFVVEKLIRKMMDSQSALAKMPTSISVTQPPINPFVNQPTITPFVNQPAITPTQIAAPAPSYGSQQGGPTEINVNASISITQQPGQSADELASIVAMKIGEAVADARAASIFV